jgi:uncharacterized protein (TIGR03437 family)
VRDPFSLSNPFNFSTDQRTRLMLFGMNLDLLPNENSLAVTARLEDASQNMFPLAVEFVGKVPGFDWLTEIVVRLPDNTPVNQTLNVSVTLRGKTSNKVKVRIK